MPGNALRQNSETTRTLRLEAANERRQHCRNTKLFARCLVRDFIGSFHEMPSLFRISLTLASMLALAACGVPASKQNIVASFKNKTIYTESPRNYMYMRADGRAFNVELDAGQKHLGRWWAEDGRVCEDFPTDNGVSCIPIYEADGRVQVPFPAKLVSGDPFGVQRQFSRTPSRSSSNRTSGVVDCTGDLACAIRNTPGGDLAAAVVGAAIVGGTKAIANAPAGTFNTPASPTSNATSNSATSNSSRAANASVSGYKIFERIRYSSGQDVVARGKCNNGNSFNVRYYPNNGNGSRDHAIYSLFGSSVEDVASRFCK